MISFVSGKLIEKNPTSAVIDVNGVGYFVSISFKTFEKLPEKNENIKLHTHLIHKEDSMQLFGFYDEKEKSMFEYLISISGIGPKIAQTILSGISPEELKNYIINGNVNSLVAIPGIGRKTAERIIVEIKDKLVKSDFGQSFEIQTSESTKQQAFLALLTLGYQRQAAEKALQKALSEIPQSEQNIETLIKKSLNILNS